jgi:hypothetical protein
MGYDSNYNKYIKYYNKYNKLKQIKGGILYNELLSEEDKRKKDEDKTKRDAALQNWAEIDAIIKRYRDEFERYPLSLAKAAEAKQLRKGAFNKLHELLKKLTNEIKLKFFEYYIHITKLYYLMEFCSECMDTVRTTVRTTETIRQILERLHEQNGCYECLKQKTATFNNLKKLAGKQTIWYMILYSEIYNGDAPEWKVRINDLTKPPVNIPPIFRKKNEQHGYFMLTTGDFVWIPDNTVTGTTTRPGMYAENEFSVRNFKAILTNARTLTHLTLDQIHFFIKEQRRVLPFLFSSSNHNVDTGQHRSLSQTTVDPSGFHHTPGDDPMDID